MKGVMMMISLFELMVVFVVVKRESDENSRGQQEIKNIGESNSTQL